LSEMRITERLNKLGDLAVSVAWLLGSVMGALLVGALLIALVGVNPLSAYRALIQGAFGNKYAISETLALTTPMILTGLAISVAYRSKLVNLGAEGQLIVGAIVAAGLAMSLGGLPPLVAVLLISVGAFVAGSAFALIPAVLKAKLNVNEIIVGLMLNFVSIYLLSYLVEGPWKASGSLIPRSPDLPVSTQLPRIWGGNYRVSVFLFVAIAAAIVVYVVFRWTTFGFRLKVVGSDPNVARFSGIRIGFYQVAAMLISGGLAGLAGYAEVGGVFHYLQAGVSAGYGYYGFVVAFMARLHPIGCIFTAFFFAVLLNGAESMQRTVGVPIVLVRVIQGLVLFFVIGTDTYRRRRERLKV
jgi:general nucleoside transport system permease protein